MTKKQLIVLWIGLSVIGAMCLVPPWASNSSSGFWYFRGYHVILTFGNETRHDHIYITRLAIQCAIVAALTFGVIMTMGRKRLPKTGDKGGNISWRRGFKRITLLLAIGAGAVGAICAGAIPVAKYHDAQKNDWPGRLVVRTASAQELKEFEKWQQEMATKGTVIDSSYFDIEDERVHAQPKPWSPPPAAFESDKPIPPPPPGFELDKPVRLDSIGEDGRSYVRDSARPGKYLVREPVTMTWEEANELVSSTTKGAEKKVRLTPVDYDPFAMRKGTDGRWYAPDLVRPGKYFVNEHAAAGDQLGWPPDWKRTEDTPDDIVHHFPSLNDVRPDLLKMNTVRFWAHLSMPKLVGFCALAGLAGAATAFVGVWIVLWFGGLGVHRVVRWVVLGFQDKAVKS